MVEVIKVDDCGSNIGDYDIPIHNAIIIPEGATNGDMIEAMFPNLKGKEKAFAIHLYVNKDKVGEVSMDWWNAPYKKEREE